MGRGGKFKIFLFRPASQIPTCGTSDPGVMQMMMLPAAAFGDIMMTNVMHPIMDMFTGPQNRETGRQEESGRSSQSSSTSSWRVSPPQSRKRPKSRRDWWRDLGQGQKQVRLGLEILSGETSSAGRGEEGGQEEA